MDVPLYPVYTEDPFKSWALMFIRLCVTADLTANENRNSSGTNANSLAKSDIRQKWSESIHRLWSSLFVSNNLTSADTGLESMLQGYALILWSHWKCLPIPIWDSDPGPKYSNLVCTSYRSVNNIVFISRIIYHIYLTASSPQRQLKLTFSGIYMWKILRTLKNNKNSSQSSAN